MFIVNIKDCILGRLGNTRINERRKEDGNSDYTDKRKGANSTKQGKMQTRRYDEKNKNWSPNLREKNIRPRQKHQAEDLISLTIGDGKVKNLMMTKETKMVTISIKDLT